MVPSFPRGLKPVLTVALGLLGSHSAIAQTSGLETQRAALTQVGQALARVVVKAKKVNEQLGYGFTEGGCVFGVRLRPGSSASEKFSLNAGQSYVFIGSGDKTARNVDIVLRDSSGGVVSQDIEADAAPFILFQPKISGRYTLSLVLKSGWKGPAFCAFTVLRKGGTALPFERIVEAAIRMDYASTAAFRKSEGGTINEFPGTWALYGAVIRQGQALTTAPKRYGATDRGIVAVGDSGVKDLDLSLLDGNGKVIATDTKSGAAPKIDQKTGAGEYSVRVSNRSSSGPALVMAVLLDLPPKQPIVPATTIPNPVLYPHSEAKQTSPYEGSWQGNWSDENGAREGTFKMTVKSGGTLSGRLSVPTLKVAAKFKGTVASNGAFHLIYNQNKQDFTADGTLKFTDDGKRHAIGRVAFPVGGASEFSLEKRD